MYGLSNRENIFDPQVISKDQGENFENFENFEIKYLKNGMRESVKGC